MFTRFLILYLSNGKNIKDFSKGSAKGRQVALGSFSCRWDLGLNSLREEREILALKEESAWGP